MRRGLRFWALWTSALTGIGISGCSMPPCQRDRLVLGSMVGAIVGGGIGAGVGPLRQSRRQVLLQRFRERPAVVFIQPGLGVKQIHLARSTTHKQENDTLGLSREVGFLGAQFIDRSGSALLTHEVRQRNRAKAITTLLEESTARLNRMKLLRCHSRLLLGDEFIQIQQHACKIDPSGSINLIDILKIIGKPDGGCLRIFGQNLFLMLEEPE